MGGWGAHGVGGPHGGEGGSRGGGPSRGEGGSRGGGPHGGHVPQGVVPHLKSSPPPRVAPS